MARNINYGWSSIDNAKRLLKLIFSYVSSRVMSLLWKICSVILFSGCCSHSYQRSPTLLRPAMWSSFLPWPVWTASAAPAAADQNSSSPTSAAQFACPSSSAGSRTSAVATAETAWRSWSSSNSPAPTHPSAKTVDSDGGWSSAWCLSWDCGTLQTGAPWSDSA